MAIKLEGGGGKALVARPLVDELFLRLPLLTVGCKRGFKPRLLSVLYQYDYFVVTFNNFVFFS